MFRIGRDTIYVHVTKDVVNIYKKLSDEQKHKIKLLVLEMIYKFTNNDFVKNEIEYEKNNEYRSRSRKESATDNIYLSVFYPTAKAFKGLEREKKHEIIYAVLKKIYDFTHEELVKHKLELLEKNKSRKNMFVEEVE